MEYKALIFDLDNTLVDRDAAAAVMYKQWLKTHRPEQVHLLRQILAQDNHGYAHPPAFMDWFRVTFDLDMGNQAFFDSVRQELIAALKPYPRVDELLFDLARDYRLAVLTNGNATGQRQKLKHTRLERLFEPESIFVTGEIGIHKPDPGAFQAVLDYLELRPHEVLMIGDDPRNDIAGAGAMGMDTCWITHKRKWPFDARPTHAVQRTTNLRSLLL